VLRKYGVEDHDHEPHETKEDDSLDVDAFRKRQQDDLMRWNKDNTTVLRRRQPFHSRYNEQDIAANDASSPNLYTSGGDEGEESWRDGEGQSLKDFGLDEEAEFYDEDDENIPLAELLRRKRAADHR
jgi:palmitoyltransferase